ncbi:putative aarF domain-containing protein kinase At5g05200, chloroplastic isoform X2 [Bidens hawaiensis]|uniref:putative aarF domain-containing protein kinase At5g05200, chloroplastic isoform X2 n=1 Tax=Bidens hawaiensis TaxID=980011 RepID=UPI00404961E5
MVLLKIIPQGDRIHTNNSIELMTSVSVFRGCFVHGRCAPIFTHQSQLPVTRILISSKKNAHRSNGLRLYARYSESQSARTQELFTSRLQDSIENLPKLVEDIVQTSINTGPRGALRLAQGIQAVIGVGGEWLTELSQVYEFLISIPSQLQLGLLSPLYLRKLFERLGATYIKLGQFIASAPTLFPAEYVQEFQYCFDRAPVVPLDEIKSILREELAGPIDSIYEYVDPTPLASASIAQVHAARLKGSQADVVIKVLKPGIEDVLVADLNFIYVVARIVEFLNPELSRASLVAIVNDIRASMLEEVDFKKEAANIESFRGYLQSMGLTSQATAPKVYPEFSTKRVLTMERLYGVPLTDLDSISNLVSSPETSLITALNVWFGSLLACETFHADVHAGNLWVLRDGRIGFLDFGIVGRISPKTWNAMEVFLGSIATEEYESMASALIEMGATNTNVDSRAFAKDLEKIFASIQDLDTEVVVATATRTDTNATAISANLVVDERQMNALFLDVVRVSESYGLRFPREFALLMKQLLYFDRYTRLLAPNMNMLQDQRVTIASSRRTTNRNIY